MKLGAKCQLLVMLLWEWGRGTRNPDLLLLLLWWIRWEGNTQTESFTGYINTHTHVTVIHLNYCEVWSFFFVWSQLNQNLHSIRSPLFHQANQAPRWNPAEHHVFFSWRTCPSVKGTGHHDVLRHPHQPIGNSLWKFNTTSHSNAQWRETKWERERKKKG